MSGGIFISYRRDDTSLPAGKLYYRLSGSFPQNKIYIGLDRVAHGEDLVKTIEKAVESSYVLIALIGRRWLISDLGRPDDHVRSELSAAFKRNTRVIPVLVEGARMPRDDELPDELKALVTLKAWQVSDASFEADYGHLVSGIQTNLASFYAEAEPLYRQALAIREQVLGPGHPEVATSLSKLGLI
jgi:hypothetical protein